MVIKRALISLALACWWHAVSSRSTLPRKEINPVGSLAVREARLAAIVQDHLTRSSLSLSLSPNSVCMHYFIIDCLTLCSQSLSGVYLALTKWQKVCACGFVCV